MGWWQGELEEWKNQAYKINWLFGWHLLYKSRFSEGVGTRPYNNTVYVVYVLFVLAYPSASLFVW